MRKWVKLHASSPQGQQEEEDDGALYELISTLGDDAAALPSRQRAAHTLASGLANKTFSGAQIGRQDPLTPLLQLAQVDGSSLTTQLVLSCFTNLATGDETRAALLARDASPLAELLSRALDEGQADPAIRGYALTATFNLCTETDVMGALHQAGALPTVRALADQLALAGSAEARHAAEVMRQLKRCAPKRPSSASRVKEGLQRAASFGRTPRTPRADGY